MNTGSNNQPRIIRKPEVLQMTGLSKSTLYNRNQEGSFPPPINLGGRSVGFVQSECVITLQAMIEGQTTEQIKSLVKQLIIDRTTNKGGL